MPEIAARAASFVTGPNLAFPLSPTSVALCSGALKCDRLDRLVGQAATMAPPGPGVHRGTLLSGRSREQGQGGTSDLLPDLQVARSFSFCLALTEGRAGGREVSTAVWRFIMA